MTANALVENLKVRVTTFVTIIGLLCTIMYGVYDTRARLIIGETERAKMKLDIAKKRDIGPQDWTRGQADRFWADVGHLNDFHVLDIWSEKYSAKGE